MNGRDKLLQIFNLCTSGKSYSDGVRILENDLITQCDVNEEDGIFSVSSSVISESLFNEYAVNIDIDLRRKDVLITKCTCEDFEEKSLRKKNYACKHIAAAFYKAVPQMEKSKWVNTDSVESIAKPKKKEKNMLEILLGEGTEGRCLKLEVLVNKNRWDESINVQFKIGNKAKGRGRTYVIKDIAQFLVYYNNNFPITYGKDFTFKRSEFKIDSKNRRILDFIETVKALTDNQYIKGKYMEIPEFFMRDFFTRVKNHRVFLNEGFFGRPVETEILFDRPPFNLNMRLGSRDYIISTEEGLPTPIGKTREVFLYGTSLYVPDFDFCYRIRPYIDMFAKSEEVAISNVMEEEVLRNLLPKMKDLTSNIQVDRKIQEKIVGEECKIRFYFDGEGKDISLEIKVRYGKYEFNIFSDFKEKIIYRDSEKEGEAIRLVDSLGFEERDDFFYFRREDYAVKFFKYEINRLQLFGEVFYSERFKGIKTLGTKGIKAQVKAGKYNYFEFKFELEDISKKETKEILRAFRENLKFYKLKSGEILDLEDLELRKLYKLIDAISPEGINDDHSIISKNKSSFLVSFMEKEDVGFVQGKDLLESVREKISNVKNMEINEPKDFKGELREYQRTGFNWLQTMNYLEFGGILGDEMGLGKTIQMIAHLLKLKGKNSLITVPTSLIFNWLDEIQKFAPDLRVGAVVGTKKKRMEILEKHGEYDVLITTYNLLKRDMETYDEIHFHTHVIDEAQYIKNPYSQISKGVKKIKSSIRFALTGTPLENSLMELWSIFDFIMPGYLYDEKRFSVRYHKKLRESPEVLQELNMLIKPFILRRTKKEVLKELPDKIEKVISVEMSKEQKKAYASYAKHALELIQKRVKDDEFKNNKIEILAYITRLRQLCIHPGVVMENYTGGSGKLEALIEIVQRSVEEGHRILLFSQFTSILKLVKERFKREGIKMSYLDGSVPAKKRIHMVKEFNEGENNVFAISLKAGGTGLNLTSADVVIHFDPWWNPAVEDQATDRAHRMGQKNVVEVIKIISRGTIEEKIIELQQEKKKLIEKVMEDGISHDNSMISLKDDELLQLFEIKKRL